MPLLYYAHFKYDIQGYDELKISYGDYYTADKSKVDCLEDAKKTVFKQVEEIEFSQYDDIIFVSKSMGTVIAGWLEDKLDIKVRHIYLTPIEETLVYIQREKNIIVVVAGKEDKKLNPEILKQHCECEGINLKQIDGAGHRLEIIGDMDININLLKQIVAFY